MDGDYWRHTSAAHSTDSNANAAVAESNSLADCCLGDDSGSGDGSGLGDVGSSVNDCGSGDGSVDGVGGSGDDSGSGDGSGDGVGEDDGSGESMEALMKHNNKVLKEMCKVCKLRVGGNQRKLVDRLLGVEGPRFRQFFHEFGHAVPPVIPLPIDGQICSAQICHVYMAAFFCFDVYLLSSIFKSINVLYASRRA